MKKIPVLCILIALFLSHFAGAAQADFTHQAFNTAEVASVRFCEPNFVKNEAGEKEAVATATLITEATAVSALHQQAKTETCAVPHVQVQGNSFVVLAYLDKESKPLALVRLWKNGDYYIYEGYRDKDGRFFMGPEPGNHGGCSCGHNPELAKLAESLPAPATPAAN